LLTPVVNAKRVDQTFRDIRYILWHDSARLDWLVRLEERGEKIILRVCF
jgi:hypothetical protein